jgi:hypothetical protein
MIPSSYNATPMLSILARPIRIDFRRITDTCSSCPLAIRTLDCIPPGAISIPARRARSGVITVMLAPVSSRKVAVSFSFKTTGTRKRLFLVCIGTDVMRPDLGALGDPTADPDSTILAGLRTRPAFAILSLTFWL